MAKKLKIFSGRSNLGLAKEIAKYLKMPLGNITIIEFADGEMFVKFEENIRGMDVFIIQSTNPPAKNMLELFLMMDAARRASADRITAVIPYYGYARQDRKDKPRVAISAKLFANMIKVAGADRIIAMDLHSPQIQGFFDLPFDHLYSAMVLIDYLKKRKFMKNAVIMAPDIGGMKLARAYATRLGKEIAVIDKRRSGPNIAEVMNVIGDVAGKNVVLMDDLVDTAGTLINAAKAAAQNGAEEVYAIATHPVLSGDAIERIEASNIRKMVVTNTIPFDGKKLTKKFEVVSIAKVFGEAVKRINQELSISTLFQGENY